MAGRLAGGVAGRPSVLKAMLSLLSLILAVASGSCASADSRSEPEKLATFSDYQRNAFDQLRAGRSARPANLETEILLNGPREWRPAAANPRSQPKKGILLVHGLGDSPWSFSDIAKKFAKNGFLVRTVLLPGHGTHPHDMLDVDLEQWRQVVWEQAAVLRQDAEQVYLGGFSTGANLVVEYAYGNNDIAGLVLFSPAFKSSMALDWATPLVRPFRPYLIAPNERMPLQNEVRYFLVPTNGFAQFYRSSQAVRRSLDLHPYEKPVFMVVAEHDSVLDANYLLKVFERRFTHPGSRLIWYGDTPGQLSDTTRVMVRPDRLPEMRISQFSHMGILFSPRNPLYGRRGSLRICWNGQDDAATRSCEAGAPVWYSDWGYREQGKIHARLTFNPYFEWQGSVMMSVMSARPEPGASNDALVSKHR